MLAKRDQRRLQEAIRHLRTAPASLNAPSPFTAREADVSAAAAEATRVVLHRDYKLWVESWVIPELEAALNGAAK
jgi:hypothetical protein